MRVLVHGVAGQADHALDEDAVSAATNLRKWRRSEGKNVFPVHISHGLLNNGSIAGRRLTPWSGLCAVKGGLHR
jgi:hypothetical protein